MRFHELTVGETFRFRNATLIKVGKNHGLPQGKPDSAAARVYVPSHDAVERIPPAVATPAPAPATASVSPEPPKRSKTS